MKDEEDPGSSIEWEVRIGHDGTIRLPAEFVGAFLDDRLNWERDRRATAAAAPLPALPSAPLPTPPSSHATTPEFASLMRLSTRTIRSLLKRMTVGVHYLRQGRRVVIIVDAARRLLEDRDLLAVPSSNELAANELERRSRKLSRKGGKP